MESCHAILGGNATRKKNGKVYYYYQCNNCKITIKEPKIEETLFFYPLVGILNQMAQELYK